MFRPGACATPCSGLTLVSFCQCWLQIPQYPMPHIILSDTTVMIAWSLILEIQALMLGTVFLRLGQQKSKARVIKQVLLVWNPEPLLRSFRGSWISGDFRVLRLGAGSFHLAWTPNNLKPASFISCQPIHGIRSTEAGSESQVIPNRS